MRKTGCPVLSSASETLGVFVRPGNHSDTDQLITLNQNFRYEMAQWEAGHLDSSDDSGYPVLDVEDVNFILTQEDPVNLMVIGRRLESEERLIGYSYSYVEPWEFSVNTPAKRTRKPTPRKKKGKGKEKGRFQATRDDDAETNESLYLAELFISQSERGFGLGELLLTGALHSRSKRPGLRSHLFVSSQNVSAVRCYQKFGYAVGARPSGDVAHDLVMELKSCQQSVADSLARLEQQLADGNLCTRRRRRPTPNADGVSSKPAEACSSSREHPVAKPCRFVPEASNTESRASAASTDVISRTSSRNSPDTSPLDVVCPQPTRIVLPPNKRVATRRITRSGAVISPLFAGTSKNTDTVQNLLGPQRKPRNASSELNPTEKETKAKKVQSSAGNSGQKGAATRGSLKPKFIFTGMRTSVRQAAEDGVKQLGCDVISIEGYDPRCTHVVASQPIRTEKFLCAIAAGKHLLQPSFVFDSVECGKLLPEDDYLWIPARGKKRVQRENRRLFEDSEGFAPTGAQRSSTSGCFSGMVAIMVPADSRQSGLRRVLEAGNATIRSGHASGSDAEEVTHAFVASSVLNETGSKAFETLEELQALGVHCLREEFIVDFLTSVSPITEDPYIVSNLSVKGSKGGKRKCAEATGPAKRGRTCNVGRA
mmetsp:Transcript_66257/g.138096  ORF Transcript_66257/g.138096 Transcript_66257/m.138096 type:complete len:654 (+) Transcript_66257:306-2267(+)|eukprot:CAMPEP_0181299552 /NCGR_PEP_ID=MMETSP1101-20121128/6411_1 /TAXON_ID=46948 /ORGANISM="Rhodomonas abbreviata, Strain Caron Lab Isolate" /LENGTH=653 /DNA_ID=CAMNT_0023404717 /DNA_START=296 /DNA_END=2257 /DNA_ORIENTATION=+